MKQENGYGSITKLSGKRRKPFLVRTAASYELSADGKLLEKRNIIGTFATKKEAAIALAKYNENPYDLQDKKLTFRDIFERFYERKFIKSNKTFANSTIYCVNGAFRLCESLHNRVFADIKAEELQSILDKNNISYAYLEHVKNLYNQMYKYALQYDIVQKDYSKFVQIAKKDDDERGVPFTKEELELLWKHKDLPYVDTILIFIYSGWRISELLNMKLENIDLKKKTFKGGVKTEAGKNRIVPIHSKIFTIVQELYNNSRNNKLICENNKSVSKTVYYKKFKKALQDAGIKTEHTPHDCRHTFASMLDSAGANKVTIKIMMGHSIQDITDGIYTHKSVEELRENIELI